MENKNTNPEILNDKEIENKKLSDQELEKTTGGGLIEFITNLFGGYSATAEAIDKNRSGM